MSLVVGMIDRARRVRARGERFAETLRAFGLVTGSWVATRVLCHYRGHVLDGGQCVLCGERHNEKIE